MGGTPPWACHPKEDVKLGPGDSTQKHSTLQSAEALKLMEATQSSYIQPCLP